MKDEFRFRHYVKEGLKKRRICWIIGLSKPPFLLPDDEGRIYDLKSYNFIT